MDREYLRYIYIMKNKNDINSSFVRDKESLD